VSLSYRDRIACQKIEEYLARELPTMRCERRCHGACGPVLMSRAEENRIRDRLHGGFIHARDPDGLCNRLTHDNLCSIYSIRPAVCRLWGLAEGMLCPFGCRPSRVLTKEEGYAILREVNRLSDE
jgi:hypothetical protein